MELAGSVQTKFVARSGGREEIRQLRKPVLWGMTNLSGGECAAQNILYGDQIEIGEEEKGVEGIIVLSSGGKGVRS